MPAKGFHIFVYQYSDGGKKQYCAINIVCEGSMLVDFVGCPYPQYIMSPQKYNKVQ